MPVKDVLAVRVVNVPAAGVALSNNGYVGGNGMMVDSPSVNATSASSVEYVAQGGIPSANQTFTSTNQATRAYMRLRFEV